MSHPASRIACLAAIVALAAATVAEADSRLFGARSSSAGVAIVGAVVNGSQLAIAGQGGGVTFFRIDNPGGAVPCANRVAFTGSNGQVVTVDADVCVNGGQVTVAFGAAATPQPLPAAPAPVPGPLPQPPAAAPGAGQAIIIGTDDPYASITGVFLSGREVAITRRVGNAVEIALPGGLGTACMRDLGLALADGRRIARDADFCSGNGQVVVQLIGAPAPVVPPAAALPQPQPLPPAPPATGQAGQWMFSSSGGEAHLIYGIPNTDAIEFNASCAPGSSSIALAIEHSSPELRPGVPLTVGFSAGAFTRTYQATGSEVSQMTGESSALIRLTASDTLWQALIRESLLTIRIGSQAPFAIPLSGSGARARQFLAACSPAVVPVPIPPPPVAVGAPPPGGGPMPVTYACEDGSMIFVTFYDDEDAVLVAEPDTPPRYLRRTPSPDNVRYAAGGAQLVGRSEDITWQIPGGFPKACRPT